MSFRNNFQATVNRHPRTVSLGLLFLIVLAIVIGIGFIPGKVGFLRRLIKMEGASCGNDENAESQEYNEEKECITTCKDGFELTRDENDKDTCSKIPDTNCVVSEFGACSLEGENCVKKRTIQTAPTGDGTPCPSLTEDCDPSECQVQQPQQQQQQPQQQQQQQQQPQPQPNNATTYTQHLKTRFYGGKTETHAGGPGTLMPGETSLSESKILCTNDLGCLGIQQTCTREQYESPNYPDSCSQEYRRWVVGNEETTPEDRQATIGGGSYSVVYLKD